MKITKAYLKKLIKEEIAALNEGAPRHGMMKSAWYRKFLREEGIAAIRRLQWWVTNVLNKPENYKKFAEDIEKIIKNANPYATDPKGRGTGAEELYDKRDFDLVMKILSNAIRDPKKITAQDAKVFEGRMNLYNIDLIKDYGYRKNP